MTRPRRDSPGRCRPWRAQRRCLVARCCFAPVARPAYGHRTDCRGSCPSFSPACRSLRPDLPAGCSVSTVKCGKSKSCKAPPGRRNPSGSMACGVRSNMTYSENCIIIFSLLLSFRVGGPRVSDTSSLTRQCLPHYKRNGMKLWTGDASR